MIKKFLFTILFTLVLSGGVSANIVSLSCKVNNSEIDFEINDRVFDIKKGIYITIKKQRGLEINYIKHKFPNSFSNDKFTFIWSEQSRLKPFNIEVLKDYSVRDMLLMPIIKWTHEDPDKLSIFDINEFIDGMLVHSCSSNQEKEYSKKEFKKLLKKSKNTTSFELIETYALETKEKTQKLQKRILEKEVAFNKSLKMEDIDHSFSFENKSGQKISKNNENGRWEKFWSTVGFIMYEYGDVILEAAINAKYGAPQKTNTPKMKCVSQRVGSSKIVHTTCRQIN